MAEVIAAGEVLVGLWNDSGYHKNRRHLEIDLDQVRQLAKGEIAGQTSALIDMAKSDALDLMGEHRAAREMCARHV